jgi:hypothetical protein
MADTLPSHHQLATRASQGDSYAPTPLPSEDDYEAIAAAVMETARGRWFLQEYAKRNRNADTGSVLAAIERLDERLGEQLENAQHPVSIDKTAVALISHDVIDLAEAITQVKQEVRELGANGTQGDHFVSATLELEAIVSQTETATGEILEAAEKIQEVLWALREEGASETQCDIIESKIVEIYTACSFQDLTGQRSSKVVRLVSYVERRVASMMAILGLGSAEPAKAAETASPPAFSTAHPGEEQREDAHLLNGPALAGDGNEQDDVDALFAASPELADTGASTPTGKAQADLANGEEDSGFNVMDDSVLVELHDAEILQRPNEKALLASSHARYDGQDRFDVDMLEFDGPTINSQPVNALADDEFRTNSDFELSDAADDLFGEDQPEAASKHPPSPWTQDSHEGAPADVFLNEPESGLLQDMLLYAEEFEAESIEVGKIDQPAAPVEQPIDDWAGDLHQETLAEASDEPAEEPISEPVAPKGRLAQYTPAERIALFS